MGMQGNNKLQQEMAMKELAQGHGFASQLQLLFENSKDHPAAANELVNKILESFTSGISALSTAAASTVAISDQAGEQQSSVSGMYEDSGESCRKRPSPAAAAAGKSGGRDNRGSYKRRKSGHSDAITSSSMQDEHSWRKYGQKEILNAKFPRSYYRCTHKYDQACKATRQVQRLEQETKETMYSITYMGHHTCQNAISTSRQSVKPPSTAMNVKEEILTTVNVDDVSNNVNNEENPSEVTTEINDNVDMWMEGLGSFDQAEEAISNYDYHHYSNYGFCGDQSGQVLDFDFGVKDIDFETEFRFDYQESACGIFPLGS